MQKTIYLATSNPGKVQEISTHLVQLPLQLKLAEKQVLDPIKETGLTFVENALIKARAVAAHYHSAAIADDSGLIVPVLDGKPGIYSARYAGAQAKAQENIAKLLTEMEHLPIEKRQAYFYCAIVYLTSENDPAPVIAVGKWHGMIMNYPIGKGGFGYDPIFYLPKLQCSAAQLSLDEKNKISHRGQALEELNSKLKQLYAEIN